jgi:hypothetical protein
MDPTGLLRSKPGLLAGYPDLLLTLYIPNIVASCTCKRDIDMVTAPFWNWVSTTQQWFWVCILDNLSGEWLQISINAVLAAFRGQHKSNTLSAPSWTWVSTERQQLLDLQLGSSKCRFVVIIQVWSNGALSGKTAFDICVIRSWK